MSLYDDLLDTAATFHTLEVIGIDVETHLIRFGSLMWTYDLSDTHPDELIAKINKDSSTILTVDSELIDKLNNEDKTLLKEAVNIIKSEMQDSIKNLINTVGKIKWNLITLNNNIIYNFTTELNHEYKVVFKIYNNFAEMKYYIYNKEKWLDFMLHKNEAQAVLLNIFYFILNDFTSNIFLKEIKIDCSLLNESNNSDEKIQRTRIYTQLLKTLLINKINIDWNLKQIKIIL